MKTGENSAKSTERQGADYSFVAENDKDQLVKWLKIKKEISDIQKEPSPVRRARMAKEIYFNNAIVLSSLTLGDNAFFNKYKQLIDEYTEYAVTSLGQHMHADENALKTSAIEYFTTLHPTATREGFEFISKKGGDQLGKVLIVKGLDEEAKEQRFTYYIKTHQHGSRSTSKAAATHVDLKELFIYKILEHMRLGPKAHFFTNLLSADQSGFYIATRGLDFSKSKTKPQKMFYTFDKYQEKLDQASDVKPLDPKIVLPITKIDILTRLLLLTDVGTNSENFGFVCRDDAIKVKIVDFRIDTRGSYRRAAEDLVQGFIEGNGAYNYSGLMSLALCDRDKDEKIGEGLDTIKELTETHEFVNAVSEAFKDINNFVKSFPNVWGADLAKKLADLSTYRDDISYNANQFKDELKKRQVVKLKLENT